MLAYVHAQVSPLLVGPTTTLLQGKTSWTSDGNFAAVLLKSPSGFWLHVNVKKGTVVTTPMTNGNGGPAEITHVSRFACVDE